MELNRDEIKRQLRDVDTQNRAVMPRWRETLDKVFNGGYDLDTAEKAELLGVPGRRQFFKIGGATIAGAALLAACGDDDDQAAPVSGADDGTSSTTEGGGDMDIVLANTAISLEILAVDTYQAAIDSGLVTTQAVGDAAGLFQSHHQEHADALSGVVGDGAVAEANQAVKAALIDPVLTDESLDEAKIIKLAFDLETAAAQTYVFAAGALSTPELRSTIMTIGGVESRHATILGQVAKYETTTVFPNAFYPSENPLAGIDGAIIEG